MTSHMDGDVSSRPITQVAYDEGSRIGRHGRARMGHGFALRETDTGLKGDIGIVGCVVSVDRGSAHFERLAVNEIWQ